MESERFFEEGLLYGILSDPTDKKAKSLKVVIRPVELRGLIYYQMSEHTARGVTHKNLTRPECEEVLKRRLGPEFKQGILYTKEGDYYCLSSKKGGVKIVKKKATKGETPLMHNRQKAYLLPEGEAIEFLILLGIMNREGRIYNDKRDKFKQINKFLEIVADILPHFKGKKELQIVDFGCGKAYLTFALYYYLVEVLEYDIKLFGLDLKEEVIGKCQEIAKQLGYTNLTFSPGDINAFQMRERLDLVVSLHACDTATDAALEKAIRGGAEVILAAPCCQHELFKQISCEDLSPLLQHGILRERFCALVTDAARGKLLELEGYGVQILEFIDFEHTPKNLLIRAVRKKGKEEALLKREYARFKKALAIEPSLEVRLSSRG